MLTEEELDLYELAFLLRMPVYKILEEMPFDELAKWKEYLSIRPYGWREDRRTALLMGAQGAKINVKELFPTLAALDRRVSENPVDSLRKSFLMQKLKGAVGGDRLSVLDEI